MLNIRILERKQPDISVIVVAYCQIFTIKLILQSLLSQTFNGSYEILITDDGSCIDLFKTVTSLADKSKVPVKYIWQQDWGIRPTEARNNAIKIAKGKLLLFLDGDMIPEKDLLEKHFLTHSGSKLNLLVAGNRVWRGLTNNNIEKIFEGKDIDCVRNKLSSGWIIDEESKKRDAFERIKREEWLESKYSWRACFSCNLSVKNTGMVYFDENYFGWGNEDWEMAYRLYKKGYKPVYLENAIAYHLESLPAITNAFRTHKQEDIILNMRNICYFYDKCPGLPLKDVFFGFIRFELDSKTNEWQVLPRPDSYTVKDLKKKVDMIRKWLKDNDVYKAKRKI